MGRFITDPLNLIFRLACSYIKLNKEASNKLLKNLEEPPEKTIFILISNEKEKLLDTILSRIRPLKFISSEDNGFENSNYAYTFTAWMRLCFFIIKRKKFEELVSWIDDLAKTKKDYQINFLNFATYGFRNAFLYKYDVQKKLNLIEDFNDFSFSKFCQFVNQDNIFEIFKDLNKAIYFLNRNGNTKLILMDLSIELSKHINNQNK